METFAPNASGRLWECFMGAKGEGLCLKREDVIFFLGGGGLEDLRLRCIFDNLCTVLYQNCLSIPKMILILDILCQLICHF